MTRWLVAVFLLGVAVGVAGTMLGPRLAGPYLPEIFGGKVELVEGKALRKERREDRLLLTVLTEEGAILATFGRRAAEIDLLVDEGDTLVLALRRYEPFVMDPPIEGVRKKGSSLPAPAGLPG